MTMCADGCFPFTEFVLLSLLAQVVDPVVETVPDAVASFELKELIPTGQQLWRAGIVFACICVAGWVVHFPLKSLIQRVRLTRASVVAVVAVAMYMAIGVMWPDRMLDDGDPISYWVHRVFGMAMLFVVLRLLDRLAIYPLLSRGGTVPVQRFVHQMINIVTGGFAILIFGSFAFGWDIDRFLAGSAVVSIVLGLALQESLGHFFSGLVMQSSPPFELGDFIRFNDYEGTVVDMTWRAVTILTNDSYYIVFPNALIAKQEIINYHAPTKSTARRVQVGLEYSLPPCDAIETLTTAALETTNVAAKPRPVVMVREYADSSIVYEVKFWTEKPSIHEVTEHQVRANIWYRLNEKGYTIPFPIRTVEHVGLSDKARQEKEDATRRREEAIEQVPLLAHLPPEQRRRLAEAARDVRLAPKQVLFREDEPGDSFFVICEGSVEVMVNDQKITTLEAGDYFGEASALTGEARSATIRATKPLLCVQIDKDNLKEIFDTNPQIMEQISAVVSMRQAERDKALEKTEDEPGADASIDRQVTLLNRMMRFFGRNIDQDGTSG